MEDFTASNGHILVDKLPNVIYACFILHNFCEAQKSEIDPVELEVVMQEEIRTHLKQDKLNSYNSIQGKKISNYKLFQRASWRRDHKRRLHEPLKKFCVTYRILLDFC